MSEFNNRIDAQRRILSTINRTKLKEELFGLSSQAINRWITSNQLDKSSNLVSLVNKASIVLSFLANKSQDPIVDEHEKMNFEIVNIINDIKLELKRE